MSIRHTILLEMHDFGKLAEIFRDYSYIASAHLFGSCAAEKAGPMSDMDIALLLKEPYPKGRELIHEEDYLSCRISKVLSVKEIDLIDMNSQGAVFQHTVLRTGKLIYDADRDFRVKFKAGVISKFCDFEPTLRFIWRFQLQGIKQRLIRI